MMNLYKYLIASTLFLTTLVSANNIPKSEIVVEFDKIRPGNIAISNDGRMFVTGHPIVGSVKKVVEISAIGSKNVYPNAEYSDSSINESVIKATIGLTVDSKDNLWVLDLGAKQFVVWNLKTNKLNKIIKIPNEALTETSFLQDFALDEKRGRAIIADMTQEDLKSAPTPAFVVVDINTGKATRVAESHDSMMPEKEGGFALNPIAIDPSFEWIYFGAINGKKVYRLKASSFDDLDTVANNIEYYAPKPYSDGIKVDKNQNVYITDIEKHVIGVSNKDGYRAIATLPKAQSWPDGLEIVGEYIYCVVNQLDRTPALNNGIDDTKGSFLIVKTNLVDR